MVYGDQFDEFFATAWAWEGIKKAFNLTVDGLLMSNLGFILPAAWVVGLFLFKSTKPYSIGACGLWLLSQM